MYRLPCNIVTVRKCNCALHVHKFECAKTYTFTVSNVFLPDAMIVSTRMAMKFTAITRSIDKETKLTTCVTKIKVWKLTWVKINQV